MGNCLTGDFPEAEALSNPLLGISLGRHGSLRAEIHAATSQWPTR